MTKGITYFDCAQPYRTFEWLGEPIKGLPREMLHLVSKVPGQPDTILETIDKHRKPMGFPVIAFRRCD